MKDEEQTRGQEQSRLRVVSIDLLLNIHLMVLLI